MIETQRGAVVPNLLSGVPDFETLNALNQLVSVMRSRNFSADGFVPPRHVLGEIEIDEHMRMVWRAGAEVRLTPKEYDLLVALARRRGAPASKQELMREVWHTSVETDSRTLDQHIFELRRKLERSTREPRHLLTVRKYGYRLKIE